MTHVRFWTRLTAPAILAALIAGLVALTTAVITGIVSEHQLKLEKAKSDLQAQLDRDKFEFELIMQAVKTGNPDQAAQNLDFLVRSGLIAEYALPIRNYLTLRRPHEGKYLPPDGAREQR